MQNRDDGNLREIATGNLHAWKEFGVVKTLKYYSAEDTEVCAPCRRHHGAIVTIADGRVGQNLPPLDACVNERCRCYFRPSDVSLQ
jgi:SPP1 gp7 family putative phage head morphogenesis protein